MSQTLVHFNRRQFSFTPESEMKKQVAGFNTGLEVEELYCVDINTLFKY